MFSLFNSKISVQLEVEQIKDKELIEIQTAEIVRLKEQKNLTSTQDLEIAELKQQLKEYKAIEDKQQRTLTLLEKYKEKAQETNDLKQHIKVSLLGSVLTIESGRPSAAIDNGQ